MQHALLYQCSSPFKIHGDDEVLRHMGLHLDTPPPALSPPPLHADPPTAPGAEQPKPDTGRPHATRTSNSSGLHPIFDHKHIAVHEGICLNVGTGL